MKESPIPARSACARTCTHGSAWVRGEGEVVVWCVDRRTQHAHLCDLHVRGHDHRVLVSGLQDDVDTRRDL